LSVSVHYYLSHVLSCYIIVKQSYPRQFAVYFLRARILHRHANSTWPMTQRHCGCNLVDVLTARAGRSGKRLLEVSIANTKLSHSRGYDIFRDQSITPLLRSLDPNPKSAIGMPMAGLEPAR